MVGVSCSEAGKIPRRWILSWVLKESFGEQWEKRSRWAFLERCRAKLRHRAPTPTTIFSCLHQPFQLEALQLSLSHSKSSQPVSRFTPSLFFPCLMFLSDCTLKGDLRGPMSLEIWGNIAGFCPMSWTCLLCQSLLMPQTDQNSSHLLKAYSMPATALYHPNNLKGNFYSECGPVSCPSPLNPNGCKALLLWL